MSRARSAVVAEVLRAYLASYIARHAAALLPLVVYERKLRDSCQVDNDSHPPSLRFSIRSYMKASSTFLCSHHCTRQLSSARSPDVLNLGIQSTRQLRLHVNVAALRITATHHSSISHFGEVDDALPTMKLHHASTHDAAINAIDRGDCSEAFVRNVQRWQI